MGIFAKFSKQAGVTLSGSYADPDKLGSGKGNPVGGKFLRDDQSFAKVKVAEISSGAETSGKVLKANGSGGATWGDW